MLIQVASLLRKQILFFFLSTSVKSNLYLLSPKDSPHIFLFIKQIISHKYEFFHPNKKGGDYSTPTSMSLPFLNRNVILLSLCTVTLKFFSTMKQIYFENSFIVVFGFIIPSFFQFCKDHRAEKISHTETYLLCPTAKKPCVTGIFEKRKRTKVAIPIVS